MFQFTVFTTRRFESKKSSERFLKFLSEKGGPFRPSKFGSSEPLKRTFDSGNLPEAIDLLAGSPDHRSGDIMLKGDKSKSEVWIHWSEAEPFQTWYLSLSPAFFKKRTATHDFLSFVQSLQEEIPITFAAAGSEDEHTEKHYLITKSELGTSKRKFGVNLDQCLPGVYWCTIFGKELTEFFGKKRLQSLAVEQVLDLGTGGTALVVSGNPFDDLKALLEQEDKIVAALGPEHFFDIHNHSKQCPIIKNLLSK